MYGRRTMREPQSPVARLDRRTFTKGTLAAVVGLSLSTGSAAASEQSIDLLIDPDEEPIGTVTASEEDGTLTVTYEIDDDEYELTETHLHVSESAGEIPTNPAGNPVPGHFAHKSEYPDGTDLAKHVITELDELGDEIVVAAKAKVRTEIEEEEEEEESEVDYDEDDGEEDDSDDDAGVEISGDDEASDDDYDEDDDSEDGDEDGDGEDEDDDGDENDDDEEADEEDGDDDDEEEEESEDEDEADEDDEEEDEPEYEYLSAWADGERINEPRPHPVHEDRFLGEGSWATYFTYERPDDE
jgi:hypothetical protein